jgi:hypothetical protein
MWWRSFRHNGTFTKPTSYSERVFAICGRRFSGYETCLCSLTEQGLLIKQYEGLTTFQQIGVWKIHTQTFLWLTFGLVLRKKGSYTWNVWKHISSVALNKLLLFPSTHLCVCVCVGLEACQLLWLFAPIYSWRHIKLSGITETCMVDLHAHVHKAGYQSTNKGNHLDTTARITIHTAV